MQTPLQSDIWLESYDGFVNAKNNVKQRNLNTVFANISRTTSPTSDSFLLIMLQLQMCNRPFKYMFSGLKALSLSVVLASVMASRVT